MGRAAGSNPGGGGQRNRSPPAHLRSTAACSPKPAATAPSLQHLLNAPQYGFMHLSLQGLPKQHLFTQHEEPSNRNLVTQYDDHYNRHGYNPVLPPLRSWNGQKLAWLPEKSDFPIFEPPTNYGLFEQLMKKWTHEEAGVMNSVYTVSYERPPVSAFAVRRRPVTNYYHHHHPLPLLSK
uniref:Cilia and flagella associated protein 107 n=1 Tax=Terrapene triunguis TaxID=2587831 RepID=A0A674K973_9SAUR